MSSKFEKAVAYVQGLDKGGSGPDTNTKLEASYHYFKEFENLADLYGNG
jgi:diazepam-binding inhibitor (GABA receptor modulating acyl-CoA-binding protein)